MIWASGSEWEFTKIRSTISGFDIASCSSAIAYESKVLLAAAISPLATTDDLSPNAFRTNHTPMAYACAIYIVIGGRAGLVSSSTARTDSCWHANEYVAGIVLFPSAPGLFDAPSIVCQ